MKQSIVSCLSHLLHRHGTTQQHSTKVIKPGPAAASAAAHRGFTSNGARCTALTSHLQLLCKHEHPRTRGRRECRFEWPQCLSRSPRHLAMRQPPLVPLSLNQNRRSAAVTALFRIAGGLQLGISNNAEDRGPAPEDFHATTHGHALPPIRQGHRDLLIALECACGRLASTASCTHRGETCWPTLGGRPFDEQR